jgi:hypothetical protein
MILYHFTSLRGFDQIERAGSIMPSNPHLRKLEGDRAGAGESDPPVSALSGMTPTEIEAEFGGPLVVHLTADHRDCSSIRPENNAVRIAVEVEDSEEWIAWARRQGADEVWMRMSTYGHEDAPEWYVVQRAIPKSEWLNAVRTEGQKVVWERPPDG